ncbi:MAG: hypothetical protein NTY06_01590 [Candidatus Gottesmanbacteria bacterium]|nr:hypothetical protein [Candidatus Gottesmanbacteria bacterium]
MFIWLSRYKKVIVFSLFGIAISLAILEYIFLSLKPVIILQLRDQPTQLVVDFIKSPLLDNKNVQILVDPYAPFTINKLSFIRYQLVMPKESMNRKNNVYAIQFVDGNSNRVYATYTINDVTNKLPPGLSQEQIITKSNAFKTAAQEQYPYFNLFPYGTSDLKVQYDKPHILTVYIRSIDSNAQSQAMLELSAYLENNASSVQLLIDKGVQIEFKELPQDYSGPQVSE